MQTNPFAQNYILCLLQWVIQAFTKKQSAYLYQAKRLTTSIPKNREKEYVLGNDSAKLSGGIERFKHNVHGVNLEHSAIIGYVQNEDSMYWYNTINNWIQELIDGKIKSSLNWISNDLLNNICGFADLRLAKSVSESEKIDQTKISLNHYFINLCE